MLAFTSLSAPAIIVAQAFSGEVRDPIAASVAGAVIVLLNIGSLAVAVNSDRRSLIYRANHDRH